MRFRESLGAGNLFGGEFIKSLTQWNCVRACPFRRGELRLGSLDRGPHCLVCSLGALIILTPSKLLDNSRIASRRRVQVEAHYGRAPRSGEAPISFAIANQVVQSREAGTVDPLEQHRGYALFQLDPNGLISSWNVGAERLLGYTEQEIMGQPFERIFTPATVAAGSPQTEMETARRSGTSLDERWHVRKDGSLFFANGVLTAIRDSSGQLRGFSKIMRDITESHEAEIRLNDQEQKLRGSLAEKEVLLTEIHHRVKNNLQIVSSLLYLQSRKTSDDQVLSVLRESQTRVRSMALIHEKLYQCEDLANINLGDYIRSLTSYLLNSYGVASHMVKLKINVESAPLGLDRAIPCGLIINELVSNALKYAFPQGRRGEIFVNLLRDGDGKLVLMVKDDGVGLPEDLDIADTPSLGLQLVNTLVKQLDGTIEVGRKDGTEFRMVLS